MSTLHELIKYGWFFGGKGSGGSGGGTQPDWNQNDPTKDDYIKNKPAICKGDASTGAPEVDNIVSMFATYTYDIGTATIVLLGGLEFSSNSYGSSFEFDVPEDGWFNFFGACGHVCNEGFPTTYFGEVCSGVAWGDADGNEVLTVTMCSLGGNEDGFRAIYTNIDFKYNPGTKKLTVICNGNMKDL